MNPTELTSNLFFFFLHILLMDFPHTTTQGLHAITVFTYRLSSGDMTKHIMTYNHAGWLILESAAEYVRNQLIGLVI